MPHRFRKKPIVIEAFQWDGNLSGNTISVAHLPVWFQAAAQMATVRFGYEDAERKAHLIIKTLEGNMNVAPGDYIIQGIKGELYPCKADIFEATYEPVEEAD